LTTQFPISVNNNLAIQQFNNKAIQSKKVHLNFKKYGEGLKNLIIIHGFLGSLDNWHTLATEFSKDFAVYTLDMRNHGKSPHTESHNIKLMVNDLAEFMEQQNIASANILGHSMGGKVAMQFAFDYTDKVEKLIVADIAPRQYKRGHDSVLEALDAVDFTKVTKRKDAEDIMMHLVPDFGTRQFLLKNLTTAANGGYNWRVNLNVLDRDYEEIIKPIEYDGVFLKPALFLRGELSTYIKPSDELEIQEHFINAQIETISGAGHWLHAENPKEFYEKVIRFLIK
jgi:pimeloyl-ACP methyl ester carboxylesterase